MRLSWLRKTLLRRRNWEANQGRTQRYQLKKPPQVQRIETFSGAEDCSTLSDNDSHEEKCQERSRDAAVENVDIVSALCAPDDFIFSVQCISFIVEQKSEDGDSVGALSELSLGNMSYIFDLASQRKTRKQKLLMEAHDEALVLYEQAQNDGHGGMSYFLMLVGQCEKKLELSTLEFYRLQDERLRLALDEEMERRQNALIPSSDSSLSFEVSDPAGGRVEPSEDLLKEEQRSMPSTKSKKEAVRKRNISESLGSEQSIPKKVTKKSVTNTESSRGIGNHSICDGEPRVMKKKRKKSKPTIIEPQGVDDFPFDKKRDSKKTRKKSIIENEPGGDQPIATYKKCASKKKAKAKESKMKAEPLDDEKNPCDDEKRIQKKAKKSKSPKGDVPIGDGELTTPKQKRKKPKTKTQSLFDDELTCHDEKSTPTPKKKKKKSKTKIQRLGAADESICDDVGKKGKPCAQDSKR